METPISAIKYVYLLACKDDIYKIGHSNRPVARSKELSRSPMGPLSLICTIPSEDARTLEHSLHVKFRSKRLPGTLEWFRLSDADVRAIMRRPDAVKYRAWQPRKYVPYDAVARIRGKLPAIAAMFADRLGHL